MDKKDVYLCFMNFIGITTKNTFCVRRVSRQKILSVYVDMEDVEIPSRENISGSRSYGFNFCKSGKHSSSLSPDEERSLGDVLITTEFVLHARTSKYH